MIVKYPLKEARVLAKASLVRVAADANCAINTVRQYEVAPDTVSRDKRTALDAVYDRFSRAQGAA